MPTEVKTFNLDCNCEILTKNLDLIPSVQSTLASIKNPRFPDKDLFSKEPVSYVRVNGDMEKPIVTLVGRPNNESMDFRVNQLSFELGDVRKSYHSRRPPEGWELAQDQYRQILDLHVNGNEFSPGYGRSKSFDKYFNVTVKAPDWLSLGIKGTDKTIELLHSEGFTHVHPELRTIEDSPTVPEFQSFLKANNFRTEDKIQFYYWESAARRATSKTDNGWLAIDLERSKIAIWTQNSKLMSVGDINSGSTVVQLPRPDVKPLE